MKDERSKLARWRRRLLELDFEVAHRAGVKQCSALALSGLPTTGMRESPQEDDVLVLTIAEANNHRTPPTPSSGASGRLGQNFVAADTRIQRAGCRSMCMMPLILVHSRQQPVLTTANTPSATKEEMTELTQPQSLHSQFPPKWNVLHRQMDAKLATAEACQKQNSDKTV